MPGLPCMSSSLEEQRLLHHLFQVFEHLQKVLKCWLHLGQTNHIEQTNQLEQLNRRRARRPNEV